MKKLFFASIVMLAAMTSCQNSESSMSNPEDQNYQTFQNKTTARGEELPPLSKEQEKAVIEEAIETLRLDQEAELKGEIGDAGRKAQILCHTSYAVSGHACVYNSSGYLVTVTWTWEQEQYHDGGSVGYYPGEGHWNYHGTVTPRCNC